MRSVLAAGMAAALVSSAAQAEVRAGHQAQDQEKSQAQSPGARQAPARGTAVASSPPSGDALAQARVLRRAGRPAEAIPLLARAVAAAPDDADAWLELGLAESATGRFTEAAAALDRAAALAPNYPDVQLARARLAFYAGDLAEAGRRVAAILAARPGDAEAAGLAAQIAAARAAAPAWRLDAGYAPGFLSGGLPDAYVADLALTRAFQDHRSLGVATQAAHQFGRTDVYVEAVGAGRAGYLALGGTPGAHFRPRLALRGGWYGPVWPAGSWRLQPLAEAGWARYVTGDVRSLAMGAEAGLRDRWLLSGRLIGVRDERGRNQAGYSLRGQWRAAGPLSLIAGWADAPESSEGFTTRVKTVTAGAALDLGARATVRLVAAHEMRPAYDRDNLALSMTRKF